MVEQPFDASYRLLQRRLRRLIDDLGSSLPPEDRDLVEELIDANECGLALATIADAMAEEDLPIEPRTAREIAQLRDAMGLSGEPAAQPVTAVR